MTIPTTFSNLSTTPSANSPSGSDAASSIDDNIRVAFAFIGSIYANTATNGWTSPYLPTSGGTVSGNLTVSGTLTGSTGVMNIGAGQLYKTAAGKIGIGTSAPTTALQMAGTNPVLTVGAQADGVSYYTGIQVWSQYNTTVQAHYISQDASGIFWQTAGGAQIRDGIAGVTRLAIDGFGNIAIANSTSTPATPASGGVLYVEAGALKYKGSGGTVTTLGAA